MRPCGVCLFFESSYYHGQNHPVPEVRQSNDSEANPEWESELAMIAHDRLPAIETQKQRRGVFNTSLLLPGSQPYHHPTNNCYSPSLCSHGDMKVATASSRREETENHSDHPRNSLKGGTSVRRRKRCTGNKKDETTPTKRRCWEESRTKTFQEFRHATLQRHPMLCVLGPSSMAVYWFKTVLKQDRFGWVHLPNNDPNKKVGKRDQTPFYHVPGQYKEELSKDPTMNDKNNEWALAVVQRGTQGIHYATSYMGVYNMLRKFGRFETDHTGSLFLVDYVGPPLPETNRTSSLD